MDTMATRCFGVKQIEQFRSKLVEDERSIATVRQYVDDVRRFMAFVDGQAVTKELVISYKHYLFERYAAGSVNTKLAAVNGFLKYMEWHGCAVKLLKIQRESFRSNEQILTKKEYYRLLQAAREQKKQRLYLILQAICATGIRVSELRFLTVEALKSGRAKVTLKGKTRSVLIPRQLCLVLRRYVEQSDIHSGSIFVTRNGIPIDRSNICHEMKKLCYQAKVEKSKVFPHNLRHLFACAYYEAEKDLTRLADLLGHSNISTTRIYTLSSGEEQMRQIGRLGLIV